MQQKSTNLYEIHKQSTKWYKVIWHKVSQMTKKDLSFFLQISWNKVSLWPMADTISSPLNHPRLLWRQMVRMTRTGVASIKDNGRYLRLAYYQPNISPSLDPSQIFMNVRYSVSKCQESQSRIWAKKTWLEAYMLRNQEIYSCIYFAKILYLK